jgi:hypothetical protein
VTAETDDEGRFHVHGDWVGDRTLGIVGPRGYSLHLAAVPMKVDERVFVDVVIDRGVALPARVVDAVSLAPVAGARVVLRRPGAHSLNVMQAGFATVLTDEDGRFRFEHVPAAAYFLSVEAKGYQTLARELEVRSAPEPLDLRLAKALPMVVRFHGWPGTAPATTVQWSIQGVNYPYGQGGKSPLGAEGEIRIDAPPPGSYHLLVFEGAALPRFEQDFDVKEAVPTEVVLHVPAGRSVSGTLRGADGRPLAKASLRVGEFGSSAPVRTDDAGRFVFPRAAPGNQGVWLVYGDDEVRIGTLEASAGPSLDLRVPGTGEVVATLFGSGLAVLHPADRTERRDKVATVRPDAQGRVRIPHLAAGAYRLLVFGHDAADVHRELSLVEGQSLDLGEIRLAPYPVVPVAVTVPPGAARPTRLTALTVDESGRPAPASGGRFGRVEFDGEGRGWLKGLPAGEYRVVFAASGFAQTPPTPVTVREGTPVPLAIELRKP